MYVAKDAVMAILVDKIPHMQINAGVDFMFRISDIMNMATDNHKRLMKPIKDGEHIVLLKATYIGMRKRP